MDSGKIILIIIGLLFVIGNLSLIVDILYSKEEDFIPKKYIPPRLIIENYDDTFDDEGTVIVE